MALKVIRFRTLLLPISPEPSLPFLTHLSVTLNPDDVGGTSLNEVRKFFGVFLPLSFIDSHFTQLICLQNWAVLHLPLHIIYGWFPERAMPTGFPIPPRWVALLCIDTPIAFSTALNFPLHSSKNVRIRSTPHLFISSSLVKRQNDPKDVLGRSGS